MVLTGLFRVKLTRQLSQLEFLFGCKTSANTGSPPAYLFFSWSAHVKIIQNPCPQHAQRCRASHRPISRLYGSTEHPRKSYEVCAQAAENGNGAARHRRVAQATFHGVINQYWIILVSWVRLYDKKGLLKLQPTVKLECHIWTLGHDQPISSHNPGTQHDPSTSEVPRCLKHLEWWDGEHL